MGLLSCRGNRELHEPLRWNGLRVSLKQRNCPFARERPDGETQRESEPSLQFSLLTGSAALTPWADVQRGLPAPIVNTPDDGETGTIGGDGDGPMSYLDYQKAEAQNTALAASLAAAAAVEPVKPKATAKSKRAKSTKVKGKTKKAATKKTKKKRS